MKRNLRRAAVYGVAGLATAAIGATTANALVDSPADTAAPAPAPAPAPVVPKALAGNAAKQAVPLAAPEHVAPPVRHVQPAPAHHSAAPAARTVKPRVK